MSISNIYTGCAGLILFIILLIIGKKSIGKPDYILIGWLTLFFLNLLAFLILDHTGGHYPNSKTTRLIVEFTDASVFLHGPVFWFYALSLSHPGFRFKRNLLWHLLPFLVGFVYLSAESIFKDGIDYSFRQLLLLPKMGSILIYNLAIINQLRRHERRIENIFSNPEEKNLRWLSFLSWGILIAWLISAISVAAVSHSLAISGFDLKLIPNIAICLFIYYMGYFGVRQNIVFSESLTEKYFPKTEELARPYSMETVPLLDEKYKKSGLTKDKLEGIHIDLIRFMDSNKPFLNPDISLFDLSEALNIPANHLSQVINVKEHLNFFDFVNRYRVNAVKDQIVVGKLKEHTLLGIALDCGFNSKASFNRAFKKHTGFTPTHFKNLQEGKIPGKIQT